MKIVEIQMEAVQREIVRIREEFHEWREDIEREYMHFTHILELVAENIEREA